MAYLRIPRYGIISNANYCDQITFVTYILCSCSLHDSYNFHVQAKRVRSIMQSYLLLTENLKTLTQKMTQIISAYLAFTNIMVTAILESVTNICHSNLYDLILS